MNLERVFSDHLNLSDEKAKQLAIDLEKVSWIYSNDPIKRAFAVWGNAMAAYMMVVIPFFILGILIDLVS